MEQFREHVIETGRANKGYYSLYRMANIERCKVDEDYLGEAMVANEDLIWHSVHKYIGKPEIIVRNNCIEKDDILQLGRMGFLKAIKAFDTTRGVKFSSFAVTAIVREIRCYLRDSANLIRPTRTANELINRINRIEHDLGYLPSTSDLAILLDEDEAKVKKAMQIGQTVKYLDEPIPKTNTGTGQEATLLDFLEDGGDMEEYVLDKVYVDSLIETVQKRLNEKELQVLKSRLSGLNQTQTADREDISQMRVSRIMKKVARLIKNSEQL